MLKLLLIIVTIKLLFFKDIKMKWGQSSVQPWIAIDPFTLFVITTDDCNNRYAKEVLKEIASSQGVQKNLVIY